MTTSQLGGTSPHRGHIESLLEKHRNEADFVATRFCGSSGAHDTAKVSQPNPTSTASENHNADAGPALSQPEAPKLPNK